MTTALPLIILRPEPGASETAARAEAADLAVRRVPLFSAGPVAWSPPDTATIDALLLTSANAPRFAGAGLAALAQLPLWCVGAATAEAAAAQGLTARHVGDSGAQALIEAAAAAGVRHMLWLAGADRTALTPPEGLTLLAVTAYQASAVPVDPALLAGPAVALLHSKRATRRLATLAPDRATLHLVAISPAVAEAAVATGGGDWASLHIAPRPDDGEMVAMAAKLCHEGIRANRAE